MPTFFLLDCMISFFFFLFKSSFIEIDIQITAQLVSLQLITFTHAANFQVEKGNITRIWGIPTTPRPCPPRVTILLRILACLIVHSISHPNINFTMREVEGGGPRKGENDNRE